MAFFIFVESLKLGIGTFRHPDAGLFPLFTAIFLGCFSFLLLLEAGVKKSKGENEEKPVWARDTNWKNILLTIVALLIYAVILKKAGYILTTFFFMLFLLKAMGPLKWSTSILGAISVVLVSYAIFNIWLQCQLPEGIVLRWLMNFF